ncbi:MAG: single-stranded-DNA-specific exonuclease RecJ [Patescibacteria group bacterium]|nr:single-stranded-DNA-specific exonuclease RecJ [Patescibacteria group bacterium]
MSKTWQISPEPPIDFLSSHPELPPIVARLLWNRNFKTQEEIDEFLNPDYSVDIHDPYLFKNMTKAVNIIFQAIEKKQKITVHGDYDADGVCAAVILVSCLKKIGAENVNVFLPHREIDGYGLNANTVEFLKKEGTELIITCDCGISNADEVAIAKKSGMKVIITDHHTVPSIIPEADAIIHPKLPDEKYPDKGLAGGGVAFKLAQGILKKHKEKNDKLTDGQNHESFEKWSLDLVAISTVGDMVPLRGESRTLTRYGLTVLNKTKNLGLQKLLATSGLADENNRPKRGAYDSFTIGFQIAPRLNAAGRMDHANSAYALLSAEKIADAEKLAMQLNQNNSERQQLTELIVNQAKKQIEKTGQKDNPALFAFEENWPAGVIGLVAGKIKDEYYKPSIIMTLNDGEIVGSGRSIYEFSLIAALQSMPEYFEKFGGHPQACGFTLKKDKLEEFKQALIKKATEETTGLKLEPKLTVDALINLEDVDWKLYDLLQKFEPFGQTNEEPTYAAKGLTVVNINPMGQDGKHLRIMVKHNSNVVKKFIGFWLGDAVKHPDNWKGILKPGDKIDLAFSIGVNEWNGNRELEMKIKDIKKSVPA